MNAPARPVRGFDWRLAPLERKLDWELEAARTTLARALAHRDGAARLLQEAQAREQEAAREGRAAVAAQGDPRAHQRLLRYLVSLAGASATAAGGLQDAEERLAAAREDVLRRQQRLEGLQRARGDALQAHLLAQGRREQAESDAGWLALRALRDGGSSAEERP